MQFTDIEFDRVSRDLMEPIPGLSSNSVFRLATHAKHPRVATVRFLSEGIIECALAARYPAWTSAPFLAQRMVGARAFFAKLRALHPDLKGECDVWLGDVPELPGLAFSGNSLSNILIPDPDFLRSNAYSELRLDLERAWRPWSLRDKRVFWRGTLSGDPENKLPDWRSVPRAAMCLMLRKPGLEQSFDVQLIGKPHQRRDQERFDEMQRLGLFGDQVPLTRCADYRGAIDIDGNSSAWMGLFTKLLMGNTVLKVDSRQGHRQWYYDKLVPWVNFIPVLADLRDITEAAEWIVANPSGAECIADRGRRLALSITLDQAVLDVAPRVVEYIHQMTSVRKQATL